jgi:hypothetical protein
VTSIPGVSRWFEGSDSLESLSLEDSAVRGEKERIVTYGQQKEIGTVVKCYCGAENKLKVCDLVDVVGILEMPESDEETEIVIHAVTIYPRQLHDVTITKYGSLNSGMPHLTLLIQSTSQRQEIYSWNTQQICLAVTK